MRRPLRTNVARRQVARMETVPAPVGGWDTESPLAAMKPTSAIILDNWIARASKIELRRGFRQHVTGTAEPVEALIAWRGDEDGDRLFAAAGANIYDVTLDEPLGDPMWSAATSARWAYTNFANEAGAWAILANGADGPLRFDGDDFAELAITDDGGPVSLDPTRLTNPIVHKRRVWFVERGKLRAWYLGTNAIQGTAKPFHIGQVLADGGELVDIGTWSLDGGAGMDDVLVFLSSEGQVAIYQGLDPADANQWSLVGVFNIAKPVGERPFIKWGADLAVITEDGVLMLSQALSKDREEAKAAAITNKIATAFRDAALAYRGNFGWQAIRYSGRGALVIVNVPTTELETSVQFVQSIESGGWSRFTGVPAFCWAEANDKIFFGSTDGIYRWDYGSTDNGRIIVGDVKTAFSAYRHAGEKQFTVARPLLKAPEIIRPAIEVLTDYREKAPTATPTVVEPADVSSGDQDDIRYAWTSVTGVGHVGSVRMRVPIQTNQPADRIAASAGNRLLTGEGGDYLLVAPNLPLDVPVECVGFNVMFQPGAPL